MGEILWEKLRSIFSSLSVPVRRIAQGRPAHRSALEITQNAFQGCCFIDESVNQSRGGQVAGMRVIDMDDIDMLRADLGKLEAYARSKASLKGPYVAVVASEGRPGR